MATRTSSKKLTAAQRREGEAKLAELIVARNSAGLPTDHESLRQALQREVDDLLEAQARAMVPKLDAQEAEPELDFECSDIYGSIDPGNALDVHHLEYLVFTDIPSPNAPDIKSRDSDTSKRMAETLTRLHHTGGIRRALRPAQDWRSQLSELKKDFGNFAHVIDDAIAPYLALLAQCKKVPPRFGPILLEGPPGVGKTRFAQEVRRILNTPFLYVDMASQTNGSSLAGSSAFWANSAHGQLFSTLAWDRRPARAQANPLVLLDEVEKATAVAQYDPLAALYCLLEEDTATAFEDAALPGLVIDASKVIFFLTANDPERLPAPILSRVRRFSISPPSTEQQRRILQRMYQDIISRLDVDFSHKLADDVIECAMHLSPREAKVRLQTAVGKAYAADKKRIDLTTWNSLNRAAAVHKQSMGFL